MWILDTPQTGNSISWTDLQVCPPPRTRSLACSPYKRGWRRCPRWPARHACGLGCTQVWPDVHKPWLSLTSIWAVSLVDGREGETFSLVDKEGNNALIGGWVSRNLFIGEYDWRLFHWWVTEQKRFYWWMVNEKCFNDWRVSRYVSFMDGRGDLFSMVDMRDLIFSCEDGKAGVFQDQNHGQDS